MATDHRLVLTALDVLDTAVLKVWPGRTADAEDCARLLDPRDASEPTPRSGRQVGLAGTRLLRWSKINRTTLAQEELAP